MHGIDSYQMKKKTKHNNNQEIYSTTTEMKHKKKPTEQAHIKTKRLIS